ncbi:Arylsulfatase A [Rubritalea squalenifaciens DSM 18772]|uniref:Arylsulfatase A n=1 Tax=Rubritalea squalenifaciens DSM 18772 TaxID=1123071 RepID=A0A1M6NU13_9BACT|nr:sulfatase-like hydrolase/transferase [Rubritalea squalenifaciens]SHJ99102.1 Arylsulfatase A [Rubritalea squalenifaciens DSM 18772]
MLSQNLTIKGKFKATVACLVPLLFTSAAIAAEKPNVLFICVDDLVPTLGCYGDTTAVSPEIDALANKGTTFLNHHCTWAVCGPSRASLSTGLMPEATGVMGFRPIRAQLPDVITLPQHFRNHGYETAAVGKFHDPRTVGTIVDANSPTENGSNTDDVPSWSIAYSKYSSGYDPAGKPAVDNSDLPDSDYTDHKILTDGRTLLATMAGGSKPFFLAVGFKKPHLPFVAPKTYWDLYNRENMPLATFTALPLNSSEKTDLTLTNNNEILGYEPFDISGLPTTDQQKDLLHGYYACVSFVDNLVGQLMDDLEATDDPLQPGKKLSETTVVVLWGDHGFHLGDHGKWAKHTNMERSTSCPLIIYDPRIHTTGSKTKSPVSTLDIYPTLCELAELPIPSQPISDTVTTGRPLAGRSLVPVLKDPEVSVNQGAITVFKTNGSHGYAYRTKRFRYVEWVNGSNQVIERDLYDYEADPLETTNVADDPDYAAIVYQLSRSMRVEVSSVDAERLTNSSSIATGGDADMPFVTIEQLVGDDLGLKWPGAFGVSYRLFSSVNPSGDWSEYSTATDEIGINSVEVTGGNGSEFFKVSFGENVPPAWSEDPLVKTDAAVGAAYTGSLASDVFDPIAGGTFTFSKISGPDWLLVGSDGSLSGTPSASDEGAAYFMVRVVDEFGAAATATLQVTVGTNASTVSTFEATDDAYVKEADEFTNFGSANTMQLRQLDASNFERLGYLKFTVENVGTVQSVKLYLHSSSETDQVEALAVENNNWTEADVVWNQKPAVGDPIETGNATAGAWFSIDITTYISGNGTYSIAINELGNTAGNIDTKEGGVAPYIEVTHQ